jgi:superfamily I DNA/RNA helicase
VIDETQDFAPLTLKLLRAIISKASNDLFFVGDGHQRIYTRNRAAMSKCGIDIRGRSRKLYLNYRTTDEIRRTAVAILEGCEIDDLDDGHDETRRYKSLSHGPVPLKVDAASMEEASMVAIATIKTWRDEDSEREGLQASACIITSSQAVRDFFAKQFSASGFVSSVIDASQNLSTDVKAIHFATMHRAKGLEFDRVIVVTPSAFFGEPIDTEAQRKLIYVALTRAKREALLICT